MKRMILTILMLVITMHGANAMTREEMRSEYASIVEDALEDDIYESLPDTAAFTSVGALSEGKVENALRYLNFLRSIAGLDKVELNPLYSARAQHAACLLATNDVLTHEPECPEGASLPMYETGLEGARESDLVKLEWSRPEILLEGISYFARDDGEDNLETLPHRRWLFDSSMKETGFGMAESQSGSTYIAMYAVDGADKESDREYTLWPAEGLFPAEMMRQELPWSVMLNGEDFDIENSKPMVTLTEKVSGAEYAFDLKSGEGDGQCGIDTSAYGEGPCLYFLPQSKGSEPMYEQNRIWNVRITGLLRNDDATAEIEYECRMISLTPIEAVSIELSVTETVLTAGETTLLSAAVIPAYADNTAVTWSCDDPEVAVIDDTGLVTAVAKGECIIKAETANGISDICNVTVK